MQILRRGSEGEAVRKWQSFLLGLGLYAGGRFLCTQDLLPGIQTFDLAEDEEQMVVGTGVRMGSDRRLRLGCGRPIGAT